MIGDMFMGMMGSMMAALASGLMGMGTFMMMFFGPMLEAMGRVFGLTV